MNPSSILTHEELRALEALCEGLMTDVERVLNESEVEA